MKSARLTAIGTVLLVMSDALCSVAAFVAGYYLRSAISFPNPAEGPLSLQSYFTMIAIQAFFIIVMFFFYRLYHQPRLPSFFNELYAVFGSVSVSFMLSLAITIVTIKNTDIYFNFSRGMLVYAWISSIILIMASRTFIHWLFRKVRSAGVGRDRVLIVGLGDVARMIAQKIRSPSSVPYEVKGVVAQKKNGSSVPEEMDGVPVLGFAEDLPRLIAEHRIDEIIIALPKSAIRRRSRSSVCAVAAQRGSGFFLTRFCSLPARYPLRTWAACRFCHCGTWQCTAGGLRSSGCLTAW
jgi:FlaA1/EpsC-like NDP-sugar epimerase